MVAVWKLKDGHFQDNRGTQLVFGPASSCMYVEPIIITGYEAISCGKYEWHQHVSWAFRYQCVVGEALTLSESTVVLSI